MEINWDAVHDKLQDSAMEFFHESKESKSVEIAQAKYTVASILLELARALNAGGKDARIVAAHNAAKRDGKVVDLQRPRLLRDGGDPNGSDPPAG